MLENLRKQGASVFIWVVFAILIGMFVINFGQQSAGAQKGCHIGSGKEVALKVGHSEIDKSGLRLAVNLDQVLSRGQGEESIKIGRAMERLIRRELLAGEAERRGLRIPDGLVDDVIKTGKLHFTGQVINFKGYFFSRLQDDDQEADDNAPPPSDADLYFDYTHFKRILANWGISVGVYKREQNREILASTMARIFIHEVPASREEALSQYITENTRVSFNDVRFDAQAYADALIFTDEDVDRFIKGHQDEVKAAYVADQWKGKKQVHVRRIMIKKQPLPPAPTVTPQPANGGNGPAPIPPPPPDPGKAKLEALRAQIAAGKRGFAEVAAQTEEDPHFAARNGDWGWYDDGVEALPEPALNDALKTMTAGKVSDVIEGENAFYLLIIDDHRSGDLTIDKVQRELALPIAKIRWGKEAARRAAIAALQQVTIEHKTLAEAFPGATKTGLVEPGPHEIIWDRPVVWGQAGEGSTTPAAPAAGSAAPVAPTAPGAPATGDAAGSGTGTAAPTPPAPPEQDIMEPSREKLPAIDKIEPPQVERHDGQVRSGDATPIGESAEMVSALFDQLAAGGVASRVFEVRESVTDPMPHYALVQLTSKELADVAQFDKQADQLVERLSLTRGYQLMEDWMRERCNALAHDGKIKPTMGYLQSFDDQGRRLPITYQPCQSLQKEPK